MTAMEILFSGNPFPMGGLSNEHELAKECPEEFRQGNPWSLYAFRLFAEGANIANWKWKSNNETERQRQRACLEALLGTFELSQQDKEAVAGWMLSEMLTEVPEYVPPKKN